MAQNIFSQLAQQTLSTATAPAGGGAAGDDDPTSAITAVAQEHGVNPNFLLGLAQLETRGGKATVKGQGVDSRNLFNIKDVSKAGTGIRALDKAEGSRHRYRQYGSYDESVVDLVDLLSREYPGALTAKTPEDFAAELKRGRYATDPDYVRKLASTIKSVQGKYGAPTQAPVEQWDQGARYVPMEHMVPGGPPARNPNKNPGFFRGAGDVGLSFLQGAAGSVKSVTDLAGAGNAVSRGLDDFSKDLGKLKSEEAQQSLAYHQQKIKDAETNGDWKQEIAAYADMVWDMPADSLAQALGSLITLGAGKAAQAVKLASSARKAGMTKEAFLKTAQGVEAAKKASNLGAGVNLGLGVGQGVGGVKGEQYERTYNAAKEEGLADDEAQALATEAQSYGKGWMQQAAGAALGYAAAKTGPLEKLASGQTVGAGGMLRRLAGGAGIESLTEGGQGAQARYAGNTAAIDAGVLDESQRFAGVAGTAFSEGLLGGVVGGGAGALGRPDVDPLATTKEAAKKPNSPISRAAVAGQPAKPEQQPAQTPVAAGASAQSQEADPTFAGMSDSVLLQLQRNLQERQAAGDEDVTDDEIELAQAAKAEYDRRMASAPPAVPDPAVPRQPTTPQTNETPAQPAGVSASGEPQPVQRKPAATIPVRAPSPFDAVPLEQDPAITQQQREDAAKVQERRSKRMAALRLGAYNKNPMMEFLGRHGLQPETQNEFAPGTAERRKASVYGYGPVFRQNGKPLDLLLSNAKDEGFLPPEASESDLYDLVARAISGERVDPLYKTGSADALMQRLAAEREAKEAASYEDFLAQQQALAADPDYDPFATFADTENDYDVSDLDSSGYSQAERSLQAEVSALAQAYSQLGFDADDVLEPLATQYESNPDEYYAQARQRLTQLIAQAAQPRGDDNLPQDSGEQAQAPIGREAANATSADDDALIDYAIEDDGEPDYFLQAQTARQLREREEAITEQARLNAERQQALEAKAQADDERKRIEQASVQAADTFELGQNALDNLTGQTDLLAQMPTAQAESPAPAATQPTAKPQDGDILNDNGKPFFFNAAAKVRAQKDGGEVVQVAGGYVVRPTQGEATQADPVAGDKIDDEWTAFSEQSGTLGIPRAEMPQVKAQDRGAMVNFLKARGIDSSNEVMPSRAIKPTQAEFSPAKVQEAAARTDGDRSIIVSADGYVVDGHHQWMAQRQKGEPVKVIKLDQPIGDVLQALKGMPSAQPEQVQNSVLQQMQDIKAEMQKLDGGRIADRVQDSIDDGDFSEAALKSAQDDLEGMRTRRAKEKIEVEAQQKYEQLHRQLKDAFDLGGKGASEQLRLVKEIESVTQQLVDAGYTQDQLGAIRARSPNAATFRNEVKAGYYPHDYGASDKFFQKNPSAQPEQVTASGERSTKKAQLAPADTKAQPQIAAPDAAPVNEDNKPAAPRQPTIDTSPAAKWRNNWGEAKRTAESLGLPIKDGKRNLKLTEMVPAIEAKLAQQDGAPLDVQATMQGAVSVDKLSREDFDKVAGIFGIGGSGKPQPNTAQDQNAKNYAWIEKETGYAPMRPNGKPYILKTGVGKNEPIATSFGAKPSINDTVRYFATEEDAANWGRENGYAVGGNPYAKNTTQPSTPLARAEAELADWKARRDLPANAGNVADVDKEINRLEQTVAALRQVEYGNTQAAAIERVNAGNSQYINTRTGKPQELTEAQQQAIEQAYKVAASGRASVDSIFEMDGQVYLVAKRNGEKKAALLPREGTPKPAADILLGHGYADRRNTLITRQEYEARQASDAKLKAEADKAAAEQDTPKVYRVTENGSHHGEYYVQRNKEWYRDVNGKLHAIGNRKGDNALLGLLDGAQTSDKMEFVGNYTGPGYATDLAGVKQSEQGGQAFADGKPRTPPEGLSVNEMKRWLSGWDAANVGASQAQANPEPNPLDYTPKQYADAWLRWSAETNGLPLAEVREMQGDEAGLKAIEQRWVDAVAQEAKNGQPIPAKTLDKLLEVRPNTQLPESAIPDGYQRPEARKANEAAQAQSNDVPTEGATAFSRRTASGNQLPNAVVVHKLGDLNNHPDYAAAKGGDLEAAFRIADDMVDDAMVEKVLAAAGNAELVVPVVSVEASGRNKIPVAVAKVLAEKLGTGVAGKIMQVNSPKRTAMDGLSRLLSPPVFDGPVQAGAAYVMVDDALTQGGTFAALASHIIDNGGTVSGVVALTGKQYSAKLAPSPELLSQVRERFQSVEDDFRAATGYGFDALTESEARYLAKHDNAQSVRDRIIEAGNAARSGLVGGEVGSPQGIKASRSRLTTPVTNTSLPTAQAQAVVRDLQSSWANAPAVVVVQDLQDPRVPQSVREVNARQVAAGAAGAPDGFIHGETVYLVASQMRSPADAARVLLHEALGHYGLRGVFGENLSPILRDLASKRRRDVVEMAVRYGLVPDGTATDASVSDIYQAMTPAQREQAAEEVLAYMAQYQPELGFVQRAIAAIRQWLKSTFPTLGERLALLDSDIVANYITPARAFVEGGRPRVQAHRTAKAQSNLMDVLAALDESGVVDINC